MEGGLESYNEGLESNKEELEKNNDGLESNNEELEKKVVFHLPFDHLPPHILYHLPHIFCIFCHLIFVSSATQFFVSFATPF